MVVVGETETLFPTGAPLSQLPVYGVRLPETAAVRLADCPRQMVEVPLVVRLSATSLSTIFIATEGGATHEQPPPTRSRITDSIPSGVLSKNASMLRITESSPAGIVTLPGKAL